MTLLEVLAVLGAALRLSAEIRAWLDRRRDKRRRDGDRGSDGA